MGYGEDVASGAVVFVCDRQGAVLQRRERCLKLAGIPYGIHAEHRPSGTYYKLCVRDWHGYAGGRIRCWVNIEGKEPCSLELHVGARALAESLGVGTTYHLASSLEESEISQRRHGDLSRR